MEDGPRMGRGVDCRSVLWFGSMPQSLSEAAQNAARHLERTGELPPAVLATLTEEEVAILKEQQAAVLKRLNSQVQSKKLTADEEKKVGGTEPRAAPRDYVARTCVCFEH